MAVAKGKRGPGKGKRVTSKIVSEMVLASIQTGKSLSDIIKEHRSQGFNIKKDMEEMLLGIGLQEVSFMLANVELIKSIREETVASFIDGIKKS